MRGGVRFNWRRRAETAATSGYSYLDLFVVFWKMNVEIEASENERRQPSVLGHNVLEKNVHLTSRKGNNSKSVSEN